MPHTLSDDYRHRFGGVSRLYGEQALASLHRAHFTVIGLGGVGSWCAEALARSGVGQITLVELDDICQTNTNRQSHTFQSTIGQSKLEVIAARLRDINPELNLHQHHDFLTKTNLAQLVTSDMNVVIDAIDAAHTKAALIAYCSAIKIRLVTIGSSGGKSDPKQVVCADLGHTICDPMLAKVRSHLYRFHHFARDKGRKFRVDAIFSTEQMVYPKPDGSVCMDKQTLESGVKLDCAGGFGSSMMVTASFGLVAASRAIERYLKTL